MASFARGRAGSPLSTGAAAGALCIARNAVVAAAVLAAMCVVVVAVPLAILRHHLRKNGSSPLRGALAR